MTLGFEAEVASVEFTNAGSQLLPSVTTGDTIRARFSFENSTAGLNHPQQREFILELSGVQYTSSQYSITVRDPSSDWIPFAGLIADPQNSPVDDRGPGGASDTLWIGSYSGSNGEFDTVLTGSNGGMEWSAPIRFAGAEHTLESSTIPSDPTIWNSMAFKDIMQKN